MYESIFKEAKAQLDEKEPDLDLKMIMMFYIGAKFAIDSAGKFVEETENEFNAEDISNSIDMLAQIHVTKFREGQSNE